MLYPIVLLLKIKNSALLKYNWVLKVLLHLFKFIPHETFLQNLESHEFQNLESSIELNDTFSQLFMRQWNLLAVHMNAGRGPENWLLSDSHERFI